MRIAEILTTKFFPESTTPRLDLELLLTKVLNKNRSFLYANPEYELSSTQEKQFKILYKRRLHGEPIAYILGRKEFWSLELTVSNKVLIPRPETEILVEIILQQLKNTSADIADLGTGSGAIALALASERPRWKIVATDIDAEALEVAKYNARQLGIKNIEFYGGDWCAVLPNRKFDAIVSNPPYIAKDDQHLQQGDVRFEPKIALEADDGLVAIKKIIIQAKNRLKSGGLLVLEHGYDQCEKVRKLLQQHGYKKIISYKDLAGIDRAVVAERMSS